MAGKGKRYELDTKNDINSNTHDWVKAHRPDFSGSSVGEVADIMVVWEAQRYDDAPRHVAYIELKKRSGVDEGNRKVVMSGSSEHDDGTKQSGLEELTELIRESPPWSQQYVGIKFQNRELIVIDATELLHWLRRDEDGWGQKVTIPEESFHGARLTPTNNISMIKPELDTWPSSRAGEDDHIKLLHQIGVEDYDISR